VDLGFHPPLYKFKNLKSVKSHFKSLFIDWELQTFLLSKEPQTMKEYGPTSLKGLADGRKPYKLNS
jgi:glutathione peroxidase-family protein